MAQQATMPAEGLGAELGVIGRAMWPSLAGRSARGAPARLSRWKKGGVSWRGPPC